MTKKTFLILGLILVLAAGLRLWQANTFDIYTDHALYAFRALTWSDFMGVGDKQTTPLQWFSQVPTWSRLSFSDGPPLGFAVESLSLNIFGTSPLAARLPFIIFSLLTLSLLYWGVRRLANERAGLLTAFIWAISSYSVWTALAGNLEGLLVLFVAGSIIFLALYKHEAKSKWFYTWIITLGLGLLTKYTFIFVIPAGLALLLWPLKSKLKFKSWLLGVVMVGLMLSPVLIYNYHVYQARGHFDAALSSILGMHPKDFSGIASRKVAFSPLSNLIDISRTLTQNNSWPFLALAVASLFYLLYKFYRRSLTPLSQSVLSHLLFLVVMFLFFSPAPRFLSIFIPIISIMIGIGLDQWWGCLTISRRHLFIFIISLIFLSEFFYNLNTNILSRPLLTEPWFYSPERYYDHGFYQVEKWWRGSLYPVLPPPLQLKAETDLDIYPENIAGRPVIIYDDSIIWSGRIWHFERYKTFYHLPIIPISYIFEQGSQSKSNDFLHQLLIVSGQPSYFIYAPNQNNLDNIRASDLERRAKIKSLADTLRARTGDPQVIKDYQGETALEIYKF